MAKTSKETILCFLAENPHSSPKEIAETVSISPNAAAVNLHELMKDELVYRPSYGNYSLTKKGIIHNDKLNSYVTHFAKKLREEENKLDLFSLFSAKNTKITEFMDLENIDVILRLKEQYGRDKLLELLERIMRLIE